MGSFYVHRSQHVGSSACPLADLGLGGRRGLAIGLLNKNKQERKTPYHEKRKEKGEKESREGRGVP